jgi:hypothetical protein
MIYRLRLFGRTPPAIEYPLERKDAEKGAEGEEHTSTEREESKSAESDDRSSKGVYYYNGNSLSVINSNTFNDLQNLEFLLNFYLCNGRVERFLFVFLRHENF